MHTHVFEENSIHIHIQTRLVYIRNQKKYERAQRAWVVAGGCQMFPLTAACDSMVQEYVVPLGGANAAKKVHAPSQGEQSVPYLGFRCCALPTAEAPWRCSCYNTAVAQTNVFLAATKPILGNKELNSSSLTYDDLPKPSATWGHRCRMSGAQVAHQKC